MARRVVVRRGVPRDLWRAQFVDVAIAVDADVIGDVDPSLLVLVVALILAEATRGVAVVAEDDGLVMQGHASDGVRPPPGRAGRAPQASRHNMTADAALMQARVRALAQEMQVRVRSVSRRAGHARASGGLSHRFRAPAHDRCSPRAADQPEQPSTADRLVASVAPARSDSVHYGHHTNRHSR